MYCFEKFGLISLVYMYLDTVISLYNRIQNSLSFIIVKFACKPETLLPCLRISEICIIRFYDIHAHSFLNINKPPLPYNVSEITKTCLKRFVNFISCFLQAPTHHCLLWKV